MASAFSSSTVQSGCSWRSSAITPAMWGAAIDVPLRTSAWLFGRKPEGSGVWQAPLVHVTPVWADVMDRPGAARSGLRAMGDPARRGPREENEASMSPALAAARVALTPAASWALIVLPSACEMKIDGIVIAIPLPVIATRLGSPGTLLTTMAPMAPAAWAFATLTLKAQVPRSMSAIFPDTVAGLVRAVQASVVSGPWGLAASRA